MGDAAGVDLLREAADRATARGAPETAATFLRRALAEPPRDRDTDAAVRLDLALALAAYMHPDAYDGLHEMLRRAVAVAPAPVQRGRIALEGARALGMLGHFDRAAALCRLGLGSAEQYPPELRERLEAELIVVGLLEASSVPEARRYAAASSASTSTLQLWRVTSAAVATLAGEPAADTEELVRCVIEEDLLAAEVGSLVQSWTTYLLIVSDQLPAGLARATALADLARPRGWLIALAHGCMFRAAALVRAGQVREAEADGRLAFEYKLPVAPAPAMLWCLSFLVDALVEAGDLDGADAALTVAGQQGDPPAGAFAAVSVCSPATVSGWPSTGRPTPSPTRSPPATGAAELGIRHAVIAGWRVKPSRRSRH